MADKIFADGLIFKKPSERAPDFIKGNLSVKVDEFITFLQQHNNNGWVNIDLKESRGGKYYAELSTWQRGQKDTGPAESDAAAESDIGTAGDEGIPY